MKTEIIMLTDVSGSMKPLDAAMCMALNEFIANQRDAAGEARATHIRFQSWVQKPDFEGRLLASVPQFVKLGCSGGTTLYDAIVQVSEEQLKRIERERWADQVIFVITTDGDDRDSRRTLGTARRAIEELQENHGWRFVFLGANINAEEYAESLNIEISVQFEASATGVAQGVREASRSVRELRSWGL